MKQVIGELKIDKSLYALIEHEILPETGVKSSDFWAAFENTLHDLAPQNATLLQKRDLFQETLDTWYKAHLQGFTQEEHKEFLRSIGYLVDEGDDFKIDPLHVDDEIASIAGPQLVVPIDNARYALNAANARWGSLLDAYYGTDMIENAKEYVKGTTYNEKRGAKVFKKCFKFLDATIPLQHASYRDVKEFAIENNALLLTLTSGEITSIKNSDKFVGYQINEGVLCSVLFQNHGLHVELQIDKKSFIGQTNPAGIKDIVLESALSTIQDCEDSVAVVDAEDKVHVYRNWNGLMKGNLETTFTNKGKEIHRKLNPDKEFIAPNGTPFTLRGRTLLLIRNVGMHMYTDAITYNDKNIPEGFLDAFVTSLCAVHDLKKTSGLRNSEKGSIYIVKPKCHGPEEIALMVELFARVENTLGLKENTIKIGIMDEERRTTINLKECIRQAQKRVFFINTGFLDRTGDEIHTCMELGAVLPKEEIKQAIWLGAYENQNVDVGLGCGFTHHAQIGKGMWTMPDAMKRMVETKIAHPNAGASTAWVPSPTAATLHALHYHHVNVHTKQKELLSRTHASKDAILTPPILTRVLTPQEITQEIENNIQSILGYVVRWVDQGIGCSKVPDINNIELMEDRATLRISSQHLANWLHHGIITKTQVIETFEKMALIVDDQNTSDPSYKKMAPHYNESIAFQAALELVFKGKEEPNGYTEFILHQRRKEAKAK